MDIKTAIGNWFKTRKLLRELKLLAREEKALVAAQEAEDGIARALLKVYRQERFYQTDTTKLSVEHLQQYERALANEKAHNKRREEIDQREKMVRFELALLKRRGP